MTDMLPDGVDAESLFSPFRNPSGLEAGAHSRRMAKFLPGRLHINTLMMQAGSTIAARCEWLVRNNSYASNASVAWAAQTVGTGIAPTVQHAEPALKEEIQQLWNDWVAESDADGLTDFYGQQRRASKSIFDSGEAFFRIRYRFAEDGLAVPMQLESIPSSQCPLWYNNVLTNGHIVRQGVEFDKIHRRVAYWMFRRNPTDRTDMIADPNLLVRIPSDQIIHIFDPVEPKQVRGVPKLAPAVAKLFLLDEYDDAELDRAKVQALFVGFIKKPTADSAVPLPIDPSSIDDMGNALLPMEPGGLQVLLPGEEIDFAQPTGVSGAYEAFQYRNLLAISAALGIPYQDLTNDLVQANYGSMRAGIIAFRRRVEQFQDSVIVHQLCRRVWSAWLDQAVLTGALTLPGYSANPRPYRRVEWIRPRWEWVDPLKDLTAEKLAVDAGFKSRGDVITALGMDPAETDARIAADEERETRLGIRIGTVNPVQADPATDPAEADPQPAKRPGVAR